MSSRYSRLAGGNAPRRSLCSNARSRCARNSLPSVRRSPSSAAGPPPGDKKKGAAQPLPWALLFGATSVVLDLQLVVDLDDVLDASSDLPGNPQFVVVVDLSREGNNT